METSELRVSLSLVFLLLFTLSSAYTWLALVVARRWGRRALVVLWLVASVVSGGLASLQLTAYQSALGYSLSQRQEFGPPLLVFCLICATALGMVTLLVRRHIDADPVSFSFGMAIRSFGALLGGIFLFLFAFAALDFSRWFRP